MKEELTVNAVKWHGSDIFELQLERGDLEFTPGDCVALFAEDGRVSRPYSIASGNQEPMVRFLIRLMPGGVVSSYLAARKPGDIVRMSPPFGWFRPGEKTRPFVFIATGTGIAPFLAHFRSKPQSAPLQCLYGVRKFEDAVEVETLKKLCDLRLAVSREKISGFHHGRVTDLLKDMPCDLGIDYYLCGLDAMIDEVTAWLEKQGVDITHIHRECFFNASYTI